MEFIFLLIIKWRDCFGTKNDQRREPSISYKLKEFSLLQCIVLLGESTSDKFLMCNCRCRKVLNMRLFPNENTGKAWDQSVSHVHLFIAKIDKLFL